MRGTRSQDACKDCIIIHQISQNICNLHQFFVCLFSWFRNQKSDTGSVYLQLRLRVLYRIGGFLLQGHSMGSEAENARVAHLRQWKRKLQEELERDTVRLFRLRASARVILFFSANCRRARRQHGCGATSRRGEGTANVTSIQICSTCLEDALRISGPLTVRPLYIMSHDEVKVSLALCYQHSDLRISGPLTLRPLYIMSQDEVR